MPIRYGDETKPSLEDVLGFVGLGNAISDGHLVVYFPHLVVHPEYQGRGIGNGPMKMMMSRYRGPPPTVTPRGWSGHRVLQEARVHPGGLDGATLDL
jgi:GNAT superfamily N-acetyltransferase